jgi:hypothetical protein
MYLKWWWSVEPFKQRIAHNAIDRSIVVVEGNLVCAHGRVENKARGCCMAEGRETVIC